MAKDLNVFMGQLAPPQDQSISRRITQTDVMPRAIKQTKLENGLFGIKYILEEDLPDSADTYWALFAVDTGKLYCWNGTAWLSTTLT